MAHQVLTDASPLIGLCHVDGLPWLHALFGTVVAPEEVFAEGGSAGFASEQAILRANEAGWLQRAGPSPAEPALPEPTSTPS